MPTTRRNFLAQSSSQLFGMLNFLNANPRLPGLTFAPAYAANPGDILVYIFQRGALDGLNMVIPYGDPDYYKARPTIAIAQPAVGQDKTALALDSFFGLHPALKDLKPIWEAGALAAVHACGSNDPTHSHFDAQSFMERALSDGRQAASGWLSRHIQTAPWQNTSPLRATSFGALPPMVLQGEIPVVAMRALSEFRLGGKSGNNAAVQKFTAPIQQLYAGAGLLEKQANITFAAIQTLQKISPADYVPAPGVKYPESDFGQGLKQIAQLIKADVGLEIATLDLGGWDTHIQEGGAEGQLARLLADFGSGLAAFYQDLEQVFNRVTVITQSEFGRRVQENGNGGTDHGHGNAMLVMSKNLASAKVYGAWPGLAKEQLYGPGDLAITTDYRHVLSEVVTNRLMNPKISEIFPGFQPAKPLGLFKA